MPAVAPPARIIKGACETKYVYYEKTLCPFVLFFFCRAGLPQRPKKNWMKLVTLYSVCTVQVYTKFVGMAGSGPSVLENTINIFRLVQNST